MCILHKYNQYEEIVISSEQHFASIWGIKTDLYSEIREKPL